MLDIEKVEDIIISTAKECGATIGRIGASELSDAIYINLSKPKEVSQKYGVLDHWHILVRVANHFNSTDTADKLSADLYLDVSDEVDLKDVLAQLREYLHHCEATLLKD